MHLRVGIRGVMALGAGLSLVACGHAPFADRAAASFRFVLPPPPPTKPGAKVTMTVERPIETVLPADPIHPLAQPTYPNIPRSERPVTATVGVRIKIDPTGWVADIGESWHAFTTPGPHAAKFRSAVEAAIWQWRFEPAEVRGVETILAADGTVKVRRKAPERIEWSYDVAFTFNANGDVVSKR